VNQDADKIASAKLSVPIQTFSGKALKAPLPLPSFFALPFGLSANHLFHFALFRTARVIAGLLRLFGFHFLAGGPLGFLTLIFCQLLGICHEYASLLSLFELSFFVRNR
jgi:hypothetical protein